MLYHLSWEKLQKQKVSTKILGKEGSKVGVGWAWLNVTKQNRSSGIFYWTGEVAMSFLIKPDQTSPTSGLESDSTLKKQHLQKFRSKWIYCGPDSWPDQPYELQPWCQWVHVQLQVFFFFF